MTRILVSGVSGLVGTQVAADLLAAGRHVVGLSLSPPPEELMFHRCFSFVSGDVTDYSEVFRTIKSFGVSQIVHSGGISHPAPSLRSPLQTLNVIIGGTVAMLEGMRLFGIGRMVFLSSVAVYSDKPNGVVREDDPTEGNSPYGVAKRAAELLGLQYAKLYNVDFVALRPTLIYGPRRRTADVIRMLVGYAKAGKPLILNQGADGLIQCIDVKDCSRAVVAALEAEKLDHRIFNVGTGTRYTLGEVSQLVKARVPGALLDIGPGFPGPELEEFRLERGERGLVSIELIGRELHWQPCYTLDSAVRDYLGTTH